MDGRSTWVCSTFTWRWGFRGGRWRYCGAADSFDGCWRRLFWRWRSRDIRCRHSGPLRSARMSKSAADCRGNDKVRGASAGARPNLGTSIAGNHRRRVFRDAVFEHRHRGPTRPSGERTGKDTAGEVARDRSRSFDAPGGSRLHRPLLQLRELRTVDRSVSRSRARAQSDRGRGLRSFDADAGGDLPTEAGRSALVSDHTLRQGIVRGRDGREAGALIGYSKISAGWTSTASSGTASEVTSVNPLSQVYMRRDCGSTSQTYGTPHARYSSSLSRTAFMRSSGERTSMAISGGVSGTPPAGDVGQNTATSGIRIKPSQTFMRVEMQANTGRVLRRAAKNAPTRLWVLPCR